MTSYKLHIVSQALSKYCSKFEIPFLFRNIFYLYMSNTHVPCEPHTLFYYTSVKMYRSAVATFTAVGGLLRNRESELQYANTRKSASRREVTISRVWFVNVLRILVAREEDISIIVMQRDELTLRRGDDVVVVLQRDGRGALTAQRLGPVDTLTEPSSGARYRD